MRRSISQAGVTALTSIVCAAAALAIPAAARAQGWVEWLSSVPRSSLAAAAGEAWNSRTHRISYYRGSRTVHLGDLVRASGSDSREAWQARASRDQRKIGVPRAIKADKDGDGVEDAFDRWPNDPTRW